MMIMTEKMMLMVMNVHLPAQDKLFIQPCESLKLVVLDMIFLILTSKILPSSSDDHSALLALRLLQGLRSRIQSLNIFYCCDII